MRALPRPRPAVAGPAALAGLLVLVGAQLLIPPRYYSPGELDVRPEIMTRVEPEYPEAAARRFVSGKVRARLYIDETGKVERVRIESAEPPGYFERSAQAAFGNARFSPAIKAGRPVRAQLLLEVRFDSPLPPVRK